VCCSPRRPPAATGRRSRPAGGRRGCLPARPSTPGRRGRARSRNPTQRALKTLEWVGRAESLCVCGPSGSGKSHFVEALGHLAIDKGKTVAWHTLETLAALVRRHRPDDTVHKAIGQLIRADLIVIDDVGLLPISPAEAEALFRVVDAAYERRSIALTSNIHPAGFDELMPKTIATATVDRLLHHAHVLVTDDTESYRLSQATAGKGVMPLA
jgi:DNA replication protein DnaC